MPFHRPLYVEHWTLRELGEEIDRHREETVGHPHRILSVSHAACRDEESPSGRRYSAVLIFEVPD